MRKVNETFTDTEFRKLQRAKEELKLSWHDFIMLLVKKK